MKSFLTILMLLSMTCCTDIHRIGSTRVPQDRPAACKQLMIVVLMGGKDSAAASELALEMRLLFRQHSPALAVTLVVGDTIKLIRPAVITGEQRNISNESAVLQVSLIREPNWENIFLSSLIEEMQTTRVNDPGLFFSPAQLQMDPEKVRLSADLTWEICFRVSPESKWLYRAIYVTATSSGGRLIAPGFARRVAHDLEKVVPL